MTAINTRSSNPVSIPLSEQVAVAGDPCAAKKISHTVLAQSVEPLTGRSAAGIKLAPPAPDALASATVKTFMERFGRLRNSDVAFDICSVNALMLKCHQDTRRDARAERQSQFQAQEKSGRAEVKKMESSAQSTFTGAMVQGGMSIAGGAMQVGLSTASAAKSIKSVNGEAAGTAMGGDAGQEMITDAKLLGISATQLKSFADASPGLTAGMSGVIASGFTYEAHLADAGRAEAALETKLHEAGVQAANEVMQQAEENINAIKEMTKSLLSVTESNSRIGRNC